MMINTTKTVRELAVEVAGATRVFEKLGIDYCCGGGKALEEACAVAGVSAEDVARSLEEIARAKEGGELKDWNAESLTQLISHIINKHHVFTREELDRLDPLLAKVCKVYADKHPELPRIQALFQELKRELTAHMMKEEQVLFPYVAELEEASNDESAKPLAFFGTVQNPIRMMMTEHDAAGEILRSIRKLSADFAAPADACVSYQTLYQSLEELEQDLHQHIHLENNILFPRAIEMESVS